MIFPAIIIPALLCFFQAEIALADAENTTEESVEVDISSVDKSFDTDDANNIFEAVRTGDAALLREYLENGTDIYSTDDIGLTPMHWAVLQSMDMILTLLEYRFDLNRDFLNGTSILSFAVTFGSVEIVKTLIEFGCIIDRANEFGVTPFYEALLLNKTETAELLVSYGANVNKIFPEGFSYLHKAVDDGNIRVAYHLINFGVSVNAADDDGETALAKAIEKCDPAFVNLLIRHGANIYKLNEESYINLAARLNCKDVIGILLKNDIKPDEQDDSGYDSIYWATRYDNVEILSVLKRFGADFAARYESSGNSLLHVAAAYGSTNAIRWLLQQGLYVNDKNRQDATPLHFAAGYDQIDAIDALFENGAHVNSRDIFDRTPLYWARYWAHDDAVAVIKSYGGEV